MIRILTILLIFAFLPLTLCISQTTQGLVAHYSFDDCSGRNEGGNGVDAILLNNIQCDCGVSGNALLFDGIDDAIIIPGSNSYMNTQDFTLSFYFKTSAPATQDIFSRKENCDNEHSFSIRVTPAVNTISAQISQNNSKDINFSEQLDPASCWHHVVFRRDGKFQSLWLNGVLKDEINSATRVDIENNNIELEVSGGPCLGLSDIQFNGLLDEIRIYNRALSRDEIQELYLNQDQILNQDTLVFLGTDFDVITSPSCAFANSWTPGDGVQDVTDPNTNIAPLETTTYSLFFNYGDCVATDSIRVAVVDPDQLDCKDVFLANAFTPNGDNNNDFFGLSNPFAVSEFISLEIFDRWGGRMFFTNDVFEKWDGRLSNSEVNPGVYLYRVVFMCEGNQEVKTGSVTLIR